jgi:hypothetical protein
MGDFLLQRLFCPQKSEIVKWYKFTEFLTDSVHSRGYVFTTNKFFRIINEKSRKAAKWVIVKELKYIILLHWRRRVLWIFVHTGTDASHSRSVIFEWDIWHPIPNHRRKAGQLPGRFPDQHWVGAKS